jgi:hypothetical protein
MRPTNVDGGRRGPADRQRLGRTRPAADLVAPAKAIRLLEALSAVRHELNRVYLDDAARRHVVAAYRAALIAVASTVSGAVIDELVALGVEPPGAGTPA